MARYIELDALVAEIEKMLQEEYPCDNAEQTTGYHCALYELQDFLDTLEVKEVDLEKEVDDWYNTKASKEFENVLYSDIENCAKHFFELGLKTQKGE